MKYAAKSNRPKTIRRSSFVRFLGLFLVTVSVVVFSSNYWQTAAQENAPSEFVTGSLVGTLENGENQPGLSASELAEIPQSVNVYNGSPQSPNAGLTIIPTFDSSITSNPNSAAIQAMINQAVAIYQAQFSDPVTVNILFRYSTTQVNGSAMTGLAQSNFVIYTVPWTTYTNALIADAKTSRDTMANATLPSSPLSTSMVPSSANGRAIGLNTPGVMTATGAVGGGTFDGIVTLNAAQPFAFTRPTGANVYDALRSTEHEIDEILGLGSFINNSSNLRPQDLFNWSSAGTRNLTSSGTRYFSINSGSTNIVGFNQTSGGDYGDWISPACPQANPYVQNAFSCAGQFSDVTATSPEGINLDVVGYDLGSGTSCSYTINPTSASVSSAAGSGSVSVTSSTGCSWTAVSNSSFITVTSGASGSGSGTVGYSLTANTTTSARTGTITIAGQTFTVTQAAASSGCSSASISVGQTINGSLTTSDCIFTGTSRYVDLYSFSGTAGQQIVVSLNSAAFDTYLYLADSSNNLLYEDDDGGGGTNSRIPTTSGVYTLPANGTYTIYATAYYGDSVSRTGAYSVSLSGPSCSYTINPTSASVSSAAGSGSVSVTSSTGCSWTAVSNSSFITVTSGASGSGSGTVGYSLTANTTTSARTGTMTIAGQTFTVTQAGLSCSYSLSPTSASVGAAATTGTSTVTTSAGCSWTATSNASWLTTSSSGSGSGTVSYAVAQNTSAASRSASITVGEQIFTVTQAAGTATQRRIAFDFDGDNKADISIFRPSVGEWWIQRSSTGVTFANQFGSSTDKPVPADFTGDGKTDIAFWRPSNGYWYVIRSEDSTYFAFPFGANGDVPQVGDFDNDGKADQAIYRPSTNVWYIQKSGGGTDIRQFGTTGDVPIAADYDGDSKTDIAIFRQSNNSWWYVRSSDGTFRVFQFALGTDKPVVGDWTGDGKADLAVYRPTTGEWFVQKSEDGSYYGVPFGTSGDIPAPGDYDGDGKLDTAVYRPSQRTWYINRSTAGILITGFGVTEDKPLPGIFVP